MTVKQLRELLARATKGPWEEWRTEGMFLGIRTADKDDVLCGTVNGMSMSRVDASAIVALRNSADAMLDVVEAAKLYIESEIDTVAERDAALRAALAKLDGAGK